MRRRRKENVPHLTAGFVNHFAQGKSDRFQLKAATVDKPRLAEQPADGFRSFGEVLVTLSQEDLSYGLVLVESFRGDGNRRFIEQPQEPGSQKTLREANYTLTMCDTEQKEFPSFFKLSGRTLGEWNAPLAESFCREVEATL